MKKSLFLLGLVFALIIFPCGDTFAKKAKKPNPIKAPVVINTKTEQAQEVLEVPDKNELEPVNETDVGEPVDVKEIINAIEPQEASDVVDVKETKTDVEQEETKKAEEIIPKNKPKLILENPCNSEVEECFTVFSSLQNKHNIVALKKLYTEDFINSDGYNKTQLFALTTRTFAGYPDYKTDYEIKEILSTNQFAMATVVQKISATTKDISKITKDKGTYKATLETVFYLRKAGKDWKIYAEDVKNEESILAYGMAKDVDGIINAPQKVLSGSDFSASVTVDTPEGYSAIASINGAQVVEGYDMNGESFRQVPADNGTIERVLKANELNNNEAVVVSVGFTKLTQDMFKKAKLDIAGLMILMRRVDVIPVNSNHKVNDKAKNGKK